MPIGDRKRGADASRPVSPKSATAVVVQNEQTLSSGGLRKKRDSLCVTEGVLEKAQVADSAALLERLNARHDYWRSSLQGCRSEIGEDLIATLRKCPTSAPHMALFADNLDAFNALVPHPSEDYLYIACMFGAQTIGNALFKRLDVNLSDEKKSVQYLTYIAASGKLRWIKTFYKQIGSPEALVYQASANLAGTVNIKFALWGMRGIPTRHDISQGGQPQPPKK